MKYEGDQVLPKLKEKIEKTIQNYKSMSSEQFIYQNCKTSFFK